jgi:hypothetical protein
LTFAYCDYTRRLQRTPSVRTTWQPQQQQQPSQPMPIHAAASGN